jgi:hypothetical protein
MLKNLETNILKPMSLNASQHDVVVKAYKEFYTDMTALRNAQEPGGGPPDRTKFDQIRQTRDNKIKKVLTADQFKKFQDLEQANRPNRQGGQPPAKN